MARRTAKTTVNESPHIEDVDIVIPELEALVGSFFHQPWSDSELAALRKYYGRVPAKEIARVLNRSLSSVINKARSLGLQGRTIDDHS